MTGDIQETQAVYGYEGFVLLREILQEGGVITKGMGNAKVRQQDKHVGKR